MKKALMLASVPSMIEQFNMNNIKILQELGYEVDVACNFEDGGTLNLNRVNEFKKELEDKGIKYYNIPFSRSPFSSNNIKAYKETKSLVIDNKYELVHLHSPIGGVCGRLACKKLRKGGTRVIYTAHGFHFFKGASIINWLIYYPIEKWLAKYTDCLITINNEDYEIAKNKFKAKETKIVHGVGVDTQKFNIQLTQEEKTKIRREIGIEENDFVIIQVGELNKNKNQIMLIEAMKDLVIQNCNIKALLVGKGILENEYKEKIKAYELEKNVFLLGYRKDIPQLLKISNCLVSLSYREGLPVNVMEAMLNNLPIIVTNCRGNRDLIVNQKDGEIVEIGDINTLKSKVEFIINNESKQADYDVTSYTQEYIEKQMICIYKHGSGGK